MTFVLTLVGPEADMESVAAEARRALAIYGAAPAQIDWLAPGLACDIAFDAAGDDPEAVRAEGTVRTALNTVPADLAVLPAAGRRKRLLVADMDSTIVTGETLDELAIRAGIGEQVVPITRRAMNGEIGFAEALAERVALLEGRPATLLDETLAAVTLSPGAETLVRTMTAHGARTLLISGGFHVFADVVAARCGFHEVEANRLGIAGGTLTGTVAGPVVGKERKYEALQALTAELGLDPSETLAVGDGANDLPMLEAAGLGVAYRAKPAVRTRIRARVEHADLTALLYFQGYRRSEFAD
ncbi:MAG: phosphoserine phosphatase SerB [Alphaproteobacteria bacterium]|jgi:phosphoserine phosphatase|nr:phosphoserine phosphatase SerB [Alphaproteobacteria bacterium]